MEEIIANLLTKTNYDIRDIANITGKKTETIRSWERKNIINKCSQHAENNWRKYSRTEFINILQQIIDYQWQRTVIYNPGQIQYVINELKKGR